MLSGGWQTRVKLAALLLHSPNLLLLDEPTNFLDLRTQILLEHFLRNYDKACLIVSHDRAFLGRDVRPHARAVARQVDDVPGQDRRLSGKSERTPQARRTRERGRAGEEEAPRRVHRQEQGPRQHGDAGEVEGETARETRDWSRSPPRNRRSASAHRRSSRVAGRRFAVLTWRSAIPSGKSHRRSGSRSSTEPGRRSSATTDRGRRPFCGRSSTR